MNARLIARCTGPRPFDGACGFLRRFGWCGHFVMACPAIYQWKEHAEVGGLVPIHMPRGRKCAALPNLVPACASDRKVFRKIFPPSTVLSAVLLRQHYALARGAMRADDVA